jgi:putative ABC transport system permease protein
MRMSGRLRSSIIIGLQGIRARKFRTLLSMISLFLGVLAVVVVQAGSVSAEKAVLQDVELTQGIDGTSVMYMSLSNTTIPIVLDTLKDQPKAVAISTMQAIIGEPGVTPVNPGGSPFDDGARYGGGFYAGPGGQVQVICDQNGNCYKGLVANPAQAQPPGQAIELNLTAMWGWAVRPTLSLAGSGSTSPTAPSLSPGSWCPRQPKIRAVPGAGGDAVQGATGSDAASSGCGGWQHCQPAACPDRLARQWLPTT